MTLISTLVFRSCAVQKKRGVSDGNIDLDHKDNDNSSCFCRGAQKEQLSALSPIHTRRGTQCARKLECFSFDVACVQCRHPHSHQQVPFACIALRPGLLCGLGLRTAETQLEKGEEFVCDNQDNDHSRRIYLARPLRFQPNGLKISVLWCKILTHSHTLIVTILTRCHKLCFGHVNVESLVSGQYMHGVSATPPQTAILSSVSSLIWFSCRYWE